MASITPRKNKNGIIISYAIKVFTYTDALGTDHYENATFKVDPNWKESTARKKAEAYAIKFEKEIKDGAISNSRKRFDEYADYVIELKETTGKCKITTLDRYRQMRKQIYPAIGYIKLPDLRPDHLNKLYMDLKSGNTTGNPLSPKTIRNYHGFISTVLEQAFKEGLVITNVAHRADPPKVEQRDPEHLELDQLKELFKALEAEPIKWRTAITLLANTGVRRGELCGLKWENVNLSSGIIEINLNLVRNRKTGKTIIQTPKTKTSIRTIYITSSETKLLKEYKAWQNEERLRLGEYFRDQGFVFTQDDGDPIAPDSLTNYCNKLSKKTGIYIHPHMFRHTQASLLIANGASIPDVSKRLGHAQISTTMNIYAHALRNADERNVAILESLFSALN